MITGIWCSSREAVFRLPVFFSLAFPLPLLRRSRAAIKRRNANRSSDSPHGGQTITPCCCFVPLLFKRQQNFVGFQRFLTLEWRRGNKGPCQRQSGSRCHPLCSRLFRVPLRLNLSFAVPGRREVRVCEGRKSSSDPDPLSRSTSIEITGLTIKYNLT